MKKYISLLPSEARQGKANLDEPVKTDMARQEVRDWIRGRMERGELSSEPEMHVEAKRGGSNKSMTSKTKLRDAKTVGPNSSEKLTTRNTDIPENIEPDDFFDDDDDDSE
jgi:hypothetical protein